MAGYQSVVELKRLEADLAALGLVMCYPKNGWGNEGDLVGVTPKDSESLPIYARDAQLFVGSLQSLRSWIAGVTWARDYDMMLRLSDEKKRAAKEQNRRNEDLIRRLKNQDVEEKGN